MRDGRFYPGHGLERIVAYHERQDARFAEAADELSRAHRQADPDRHRAGRRRSGQRRPGRRAGHAAGCATRAATGPSPPSATSTATPGTGRAGRGEPEPGGRRSTRSSSSSLLGARPGASLLFARVALGGRPGRRAPTPPPTTAPSPRRRRRRSSTTPLLSFRRAPGVLARDVNLGRVPGRGRRRSAPRSTPRRASRSPSTASPVGSTRADAPLIPASNQKLLVGAVALEVLGADYTFTTEVARPPRRSAVSSPATSTSSAAATRC